MDALLTDIATAPNGEFWFWTGALIVAALVTLCIGAGMGTATIIERV